MARPVGPRAFTLIELLVVITIIVVLLALLTPALERAVYQSQLAVCGARQRAVALGALNYALEFSRRYPYRRGVPEGDHYRAVNNLRVAPGWDRVTPLDPVDDTPVLKTFLAIDKMLLDPLAPGLVTLEGSDPDTFTYSGYSYWFGFGFPGQQKMLKVGDSFTWEYAGKQERFRVLVADMDRIATDATLCGHPDADDKLSPYVIQDRAAFGVGDTGYVKQTMSFWLRRAAFDRGPIDMNVAFDDGSVNRYADVANDEWSRGGAMSRVPEQSDGGNFPVPFFHHLPND